MAAIYRVVVCVQIWLYVLVRSAAISVKIFATLAAKYALPSATHFSPLNCVMVCVTITQPIGVLCK